MKHAIKFFATITLVLFIAVSMNAQSETTVVNNNDAKKCDITKCDPAMCDMLVKAGICTKEEVAKCIAKCSAKSTKVASASVERIETSPVATTNNVEKVAIKSCAKTCSSKKKLKVQ